MLNFKNFNLLEENENMKFSEGMQKDWIVVSKDMKNLFCIAIVNDKKYWYLWETVNLFDKKIEDIQKMVNMGYHTMLTASINRKKYEYVIADHIFSKKDIDTDYWHKLIPEKNFWGKATLKKNEVIIDKPSFEKEMNKLIKKIGFTGKF